MLAMDYPESHTRKREGERESHTPHDITSCESEDEGAAPESVSCIYVSVLVFSDWVVRKRGMASESVPVRMYRSLFS